MTVARELDLPPMTFDEFVEFERNSDIKHEIRYGELVAMSGGTVEHSDVAGNFDREFGKAYEAGGCKPNNSDLMVHLPGPDKGAYPDVSVTCGEQEFRGENDPEERRILLNPTLVVEVLSRSTALYDQKEKLDGYLSVPSIREIVLVDPTTPWVRVFSRMNAGVSMRTIDDMSATVDLPSIGVAVPMEKVYFGVRTSPQSRITPPPPDPLKSL